MAFGVKIKTVTTQKEYTLEEFYEAIKGIQFEAGEPNIVKHGLGNIIAFPPIDRQNQVWILASGFKAPYKKFQIQLSHELAGDFGNMLANDLLNHFTGGLSSMGAAFGGSAKRGEKDTDEVIKKITEAGL